MASTEKLKSDLKKYKKLLPFVPRAGKALGALRNKVKHSIESLTNAISRRESALAWIDRAKVILQSQDLEKLEYHQDAGKVFGNDQIMHNGLKVALGSYSCNHFHTLLGWSKGVHEPQEEYIFQEILRYIQPGSTMLELGAYWSFYSMWFQQKVPEARCFMVEPEIENLNVGRLNFELNGCNGTFLQGFLGKEVKHQPYGCSLLTVDHIMEAQKIPHIHLLHSDIQGFEHDMLHGAKQAIENKCVDFIFISTHSDEVHDQCKEFLLSHDYNIIAEHTLAESFSVDGLIVAKRKGIPGPEAISISKRKV